MKKSCKKYLYLKVKINYLKMGWQQVFQGSQRAGTRRESGIARNMMKGSFIILYNVFKILYNFGLPKFLRGLFPFQGVIELENGLLRLLCWIMGM